MRTTAGLSLVALLIGLAAPARAHDHAPPETILRIGNADQEGILVLSCWIRGKDLDGASVCRQRETSFPEALETTKRTAVLDLGTSTEPARLRLRAWRRLRPNGEPRRPTRRLVVGLEDGDGGWLAGFALPQRPGTWYLEAKAVWPDRSFPENEQFGVWTFSVRTS